MKFLKVLFTIIGILVVLGLIFFVVDSSKIKAEKEPIFVIEVSDVEGTTKNIGLGYLVYEYETEQGTVVREIGTWFKKPNEELKEDTRIYYNFKNNPIIEEPEIEVDENPEEENTEEDQEDNNDQDIEENEEETNDNTNNEEVTNNEETTNV